MKKQQQVKIDSISVIILTIAAGLKEKVLVFSQSLLALELIERVLEEREGWKLGSDYFHLRGSTSGKVCARSLACRCCCLLAAAAAAILTGSAS